MRTLVVVIVVLVAVALVPADPPTFSVAVNRDDSPTSISQRVEQQARQQAYWQPYDRDVRHAGYPARTTIDPFRPVRRLLGAIAFAGQHVEAHLEGAIADLVAGARGVRLG